MTAKSSGCIARISRHVTTRSQPWRWLVVDPAVLPVVLWDDGHGACSSTSQVLSTSMLPAFLVEFRHDGARTSKGRVSRPPCRNRGRVDATSTLISHSCCRFCDAVSSASVLPHQRRTQANFTWKGTRPKHRHEPHDQLATAIFGSELFCRPCGPFKSKRATMVLCTNSQLARSQQSQMRSSRLPGLGVVIIST